MANVLGMKRPYALLRHKIFHFDRLEVLTKKRRSIDVRHDDCEPNILSDKRKLQVISLGLHRNCQRKTLAKECCFNHGPSTTTMRVQYPWNGGDILKP